MKRAFTILLALCLCVGFCACNSTLSTPKETALTLDNYETYLQVDTSCYVSGESVYFMDPIPGYTGPWQSEIMCSASVKGVSGNFNYNDVVVVVEFSGEYDAYHSYENALHSADNTFQVAITVNANIAGNGDGSDTFKLEYPLVTRNALISATCRVVSISGTVTPA